jgi:hypothetical protein
MNSIVSICPKCQQAHGREMSDGSGQFYCPACSHRWRPPVVLNAFPMKAETPRENAERIAGNNAWLQRVDSIIASAMSAPMPLQSA